MPCQRVLKRTNMIKGNQFLLLFLGLIILNSGISQVNSQKPDITRIYEDAERLYRTGNYNASLELLKKESGDWLVNSDTLMYIKIKNLDNLYKSNFDQTKDLESTLQRFFARVNKNTFPELKYSEVTTIFTTFQSFKERDKTFYDSVFRVIDLNKTNTLIPLRQVANEYLKSYPNTYYSKELNGYVNSIDTKLAQLETANKKKIKDSTNRAALKKVGKMVTLNISYSVPSGGKTVFGGLDNHNEIMSFYNGTYTGELGENYSIGASLAEAFINIYTGTRAKVGLNWSLFDGEYTVFDWNNNSLVSEEQNTNKPIKELKSIKAGTRIGPVVAILLSRSVSVALYYSARPGVQFLIGKTYFTVPNGSNAAIPNGSSNATTYEIKPVQTNYNFSSEAGIKIYFFKKIFINPYMHFGKYNWQSEIKDVSASSSGNTTIAQANYDFKSIGIRVGF